MADVELMATKASDALRVVLVRLVALVRGLALLCAVVGVATYAAGRWLSDSATWAVLGAVVCALPVFAAAAAWWRLDRTRAVAPDLLDELRDVIGDRQSRPAMGVLIDGDTQQPIITTARTLTGLRAEIASRHDDWPALSRTLWAATTVPGLAALAVLGMLCIGALGTVLTVIGLAR